MLNKLKEEYNFRYKCAQYERYYRQYLYNCFEKNNVKILTAALYDIVPEDSRPNCAALEQYIES